MAPDLPIELWMEIFSYLPPGTVRDMLVVSRQLFQLSMAEKYRKFEVAASDTRTLERIREPFITQHVKWIEINSSFLSAADDDFRVMAVPQRSPPPPSTPRSLRKKLKSLLSTSKSKQQWTNQPAEPAEVVATLAAHLPNFLQLGEVTLRLDFPPWTGSLSDLLCSVWAQRGQSIHTLHIEATLPHLGDFFETCSKTLPHLSSLSLEFLSSRMSRPPSNSATLCSKIIAFIRSHEDTLETLVLHEPPFVTFVDLSTFIRDLGFLPRLKRLKIPVVFPSMSLSQLEYLQGFLALHVSTLERLDLCFKRVYFFTSDAHQTFRQLINDILPTLELPVLHELGLDVYLAERVRPHFRLPPFTTFAPNIKELKLRGTKSSLDFTEFKMLLLNLSNVDLRTLHLQIDYLCPEHFDLLALHLPMLESLELTYMDVSFISGVHMFHAASHVDFTFGTRFDNRRYINWRLKYLRVSHRSSCETGHPQRNLSAMVAMSIPGLEMYDVERRCGCLS